MLKPKTRSRDCSRIIFQVSMLLLLVLRKCNFMPRSGHKRSNLLFPLLWHFHLITNWVIPKMAKTKTPTFLQELNRRSGSKWQCKERGPNIQHMVHSFTKDFRYLNMEALKLHGLCKGNPHPPFNQKKDGDRSKRQHD